MAAGGALISTTRVATMPASGISSSPATCPPASCAVAPQVMCQRRRKPKYATATPASAPSTVPVRLPIMISSICRIATLAPSADAGIVSPGGFVIGTGPALNLACLRQWR